MFGFQNHSSFSFHKSGQAIINLSAFGFGRVHSITPIPDGITFIVSIPSSASPTTVHANLFLSQLSDISIWWGDNTTNTYSGTTVINASHTYTQGNYTVVIYNAGQFFIKDFSLINYVQSIDLNQLPNDIVNLTITSAYISLFNRSTSFTSLINLDLTLNQLTAFNPPFSLPNTLNRLALQYNDIAAFNPTYALPEGLEFLDVGNNRLQQFNPTLPLPSTLLQLNLYTNFILEFNPTLPLPSAIQSLDVNLNRLTNFNPTLPLPTSLTYLKLSLNNFVTFNPSIALPSGLQTLLLDQNEMTSFAPTIPLPSTINNIDLKLNKLSTTQVNNTLVYLDAATFNSGTKILNIKQAPAAPPSGAGLVAKTSLQAKGWIITDDSTPIAFNFTVVRSAGQSKSFFVGNTTNFNVTVNWGDGTINSYSGSDTYITSHTYTLAGTYNVQLYNGANLPTCTTLNLAYDGSGGVDYVNWEMLPTLVESFVSANLLTTFNPSIALPNSLSSLVLGNNQLTSFNPSIALPTGLTYLNLGDNQLTSFNPSIALPNSLSLLYLDNNQLSSFNPNIALPNSLSFLYLYNNQLTSFNPIIALPSSLAYLELPVNQLTTFNPSIALPNNLAYLSLSDNQLTTFNPSIALPNNLNYLYLSGNQLTIFNPSIALPISLNILELSSNPFDETGVNNTLIYLDSSTFTNPGTIGMAGLPYPTGDGEIALVNLQIKGWSIYFN